MTKIDIDTLDSNLIADLADDASLYEAFEAPYEGATVSNQCYHVVYSAEIGNGGIVLVGSGSSGRTNWTDAKSADDVLARYLAGEMVA